MRSGNKFSDVYLCDRPYDVYAGDRLYDVHCGQKSNYILLVTDLRMCIQVTDPVIYMLITN